MLVFRKISENTHFKIRPFALLPTIYGILTKINESESDFLALQ